MTTCCGDCDLEKGLFSGKDFTMSQQGRNCKDCIMCSPGSIERKVQMSEKQILILSQSDVGIKCGICNKFCCIQCLRKVINVFPTVKSKRNHWYMYVSAMIKEEDMAEPIRSCYPAGPFVGQCCELRFFKRGAIPIQLEQTRFDGCLFLPEYKLILSPCFSSDGMVDIHGFGGMHPYFTGVVHCVPSQTSCIEYEKGKVVATGSGSSYRHYW